LTTNTLKSLARIAVTYLADWCVIDVVERERRAAPNRQCSHDPVKEKLLMELQEKVSTDTDSPQPSARVFARQVRAATGSDRELMTERVEHSAYAIDQDIGSDLTLQLLCPRVIAWAIKSRFV